MQFPFFVVFWAWFSHYFFSTSIFLFFFNNKINRITMHSITLMEWEGLKIERCLMFEFLSLLIHLVFFVILMYLVEAMKKLFCFCSTCLEKVLYKASLIGCSHKMTYGLHQQNFSWLWMVWSFIDLQLNSFGKPLNSLAQKNDMLANYSVSIMKQFPRKITRTIVF